MDQDLLVEAGHQLLKKLDQTPLRPRAAMWVNTQDTSIWRLWVVPANDKQDAHGFYRIVSEAISRNRDSMHNLDVSDIELMRSNHPAIQGLKALIRMEGEGSAHFSNNTLNGFFLPDGIVLRMAF